MMGYLTVIFNGEAEKREEHNTTAPAVVLCSLSIYYKVSSKKYKG